MLSFRTMVFATLCAGTASAFMIGSRSGSRFAVTRSNRAVQAVSRIPTRKSSTLLMGAASPAEFVKSEIENNDVIVFSKSYCPFCTATKNTLSDLGVEANVVELDLMDDGAQIQAALLDISGQRTVPNVFIKGKHLGGNDDTQAAVRSGKLAEMIGN